MKLMYLYCSPQSHHLSLSYQCVSITGSQSVVTCPRLDAPTGGKLTCSGPETGPVPAGTQCTLACKKGYLRQGNSQRSVTDFPLFPLCLNLLVNFMKHLQYEPLFSQDVSILGPAWTLESGTMAWAGARYLNFYLGFFFT